MQKQFQTDDEDAEYKGIRDAILKIYRKEGGVRAFYSGVLQETFKGVADSFLFFLAYTYIREKRLATYGSRYLTVPEEIGVGVLAGAFSKFWTTPIQNVVTRKQTAAMIAARDPMSTISPQLSTKDIALQIRHEKGLQGFWSGYSASLILTLNPSITFLLHRILLRFFVPKSRRSDPGARITFLLAAISKAMASAITYPFSLAKTRAQVSSQKPSQATEPISETEKPESAIVSKVERARQRTVFSTILHIARTEGLWALYQGLGAEVLKGFFSHGITMLMKDQIHTLVIDMYYLILKALKKFPSPEELAKLAADQTKEAYEQGKEQVGGAYARTVEVAESASATAQTVLTNGRHQAEEMLGKTKDAASNATKQVQDTLVKTDVKDVESGDKE